MCAKKTLKLLNYRSYVIAFSSEFHSPQLIFLPLIPLSLALPRIECEPVPRLRLQRVLTWLLALLKVGDIEYIMWGRHHHIFRIMAFANFF